MTKKSDPLPDSKRITIAAVDAWIELVPVGDSYYRLVGGGRHVPRGAYTAHLDHARKAFTLEETDA